MQRLIKILGLELLMLTVWVNVCSAGTEQAKEITAKHFSYAEHYKSAYGTEDKLYIIGHKNPDSDTVCSAIAYAELKNRLGIPAEAIVCGPLNGETEFALKYFDIQPPKLVSDVSGRRIALVDHSSYLQGVKGLKSAEVLEIVDHHRLEDVIPKKPITMRFAPLGSANTIIYGIYKENKLKPFRNAAAAMLIGIMSDTNNLTSSLTTSLDRLAVKELAHKVKLKDRDALYRDMVRAQAGYKGKTDEQIFHSDAKEYNFNGYRIIISSIMAPDEGSIEAMASRMQAIMPKIREKMGADMLFAKVEYALGTKTALLHCGKDSLQMLQAAYGNPEDGRLLVDRHVPRKNDLVPNLSREIGKLPAKVN